MGEIQITRKDIERLEPGGLLNDNIIDFYLAHLQKLYPLKKVHVFSSTSYPLIRHDDFNVYNRFARRVPKSEKIFEMQGLFIPINTGNHWSLVMVRNLHKFKENGTSIVYYDSIAEKWSKDDMVPVWRYLKLRYLYEQGFDNVSPLIYNSYTFTCKQYMAKVPKQINSYDCGVYVLEYMERLLKEFPNATDNNESWFSQSEIDKKREKIKELLTSKSYP